MPGDAMLAPVVKHVDLDGAVVVRSRGWIVAGDRGVGGDDLFIRRGKHLGLGLRGPLHHEVAGGGAGAVADLIVVHHAPGSFHLAGEVEARRRRGQRRGGVGSEQQSARIVPGCLFAELELHGVDASWIGLHGHAFLASVGAVAEHLYRHG